MSPRTITSAPGWTRVDVRKNDLLATSIRLLDALRLRDECGRLEAPEERLVATLRVEVVADDEELPAVVGELAGERLAARHGRACWTARCGRGSP